MIDRARAAEIIKRSATEPSALIGYSILVKGHGVGIVRSIVKRRFQPTLFAVEMVDAGEGTEVAMLDLRRGAKKGSLPFQVLKKVE